MNQLHTKGPWKLDKEIDGFHSGSKTWIKGEDNKLVCKTTNQTRSHMNPAQDVCEANAKRIVACVNEFEGVPQDKVVGFMELTKNALVEAHAELSNYANENEYRYVISIIDNILEALARFPKEKE